MQSTVGVHLWRSRVRPHYLLEPMYFYNFGDLINDIANVTCKSEFRSDFKKTTSHLPHPVFQTFEALLLDFSYPPPGREISSNVKKLNPKVRIKIPRIIRGKDTDLDEVKSFLKSTKTFKNKLLLCIRFDTQNITSASSFTQCQRIIYKQDMVLNIKNYSSGHHVFGNPHHGRLHRPCHGRHCRSHHHQIWKIQALANMDGATNGGRRCSDLHHSKS